jgi:hypothetical protein
VENGKLVKLAMLPVTDGGSTWNSRFCFIGNVLFWVSESSILAYDYTAFSLLNTLEFGW